MRQLEQGDRVRVDIPDTTDPDFEQFHSRIGEVVSVLADDAGTETGDERDSYPFEVEFDSGECAEFRWRDLRPISAD